MLVHYLHIRRKFEMAGEQLKLLPLPTEKDAEQIMERWFEPVSEEQVHALSHQRK